MDSVCQQKNVNEEPSPHQVLVLKDTSKMRVKGGNRWFQSCSPDPSLRQYDNSQVGIRIFQSVSPLERNPAIQVSNRLLVARYEGQRK